MPKKDLWSFLNKLYETYFPEHSRKLRDMFIREKKLVPVKFKGFDEETTGLCHKVVNKNSSSGSPSLHNVLIARHPEKKVLTMWCGDSSVAKSDRESESKCEFWRKFGINGEEAGYACKHIIFVVQEMDNRERKRIEEMLGVTTTFTPNGDGLSLALRFGKNVFLYGPTGSGKTHKVREMLKGHASAEVRKIHITDGLEDVDLLQKLLPEPEGKGWRRLEGELRIAFNAARERKVIVVLEELTRSSRSLRNLLIKAMDKEDVNYTLHDITTGERITVPAENLMFIATANLAYSDTSELDPALARRFPICVFHDYDPSQEKRLLDERLDKKSVAKLCAVAKAMREQYRQGRLPYPLDTGSLLEWADLIASGVDVLEAAEVTWLYRVVERDNLGYPEAGQISAIMDLLR